MAEEPQTEKKEETQAERLKRLGNEAFAAKKYDEAIIQYSAAMTVDPENAILYSNRSACYAFQKKWQLALDDAKTCLAKDPKFIKGYYRLCSAQIELGQFDDAEVTVIAALKIDPQNEPILKQRRTIAQKRASGAVGTVKAPTKQLDEAQRKELDDLQNQITSYKKDLRNVMGRIQMTEREAKSCNSTMNYLSAMPPTAPVYRGVGKAYMKTERTEIDRRLESEMGASTKNLRDLGDRQEYLERRLQSSVQNYKDLTVGL